MAIFTIHLLPRTSTIPVRQPVVVLSDGELPEYGQIWVWDMFYAQQLQALGHGSFAAELKETLELWAINMSSKVFQPHDHVRSKGHLQLCSGLEWISNAEFDASRRASAQAVTVTVDIPSGGMPVVRTSPDILPQESRYWLVLSLAQYFIEQNVLFARELPIHVLAFRKYHADINEPHTSVAAEEAPYFALQKAMEYFQSAERAP